MAARPIPPGGTLAGDVDGPRRAPGRTGVGAVDLRVTLPPRYHMRWQHPFEDAVAQRLRRGITVLDVGSGRNPTIAPGDRPENTTYIGLDVSDVELEAAATGSYDHVVVTDVTRVAPELLGSVDLAISWQVFEHVKPLSSAFDNLHAYLRPGGALISLFSGKWSAFGVANRLIPSGIGLPLVERAMRRRATNRPAFPAYYDRCTDTAIRAMMRNWGDTEVYSLYCGATYFHFSAALTRAYLAYENAVRRMGLTNLATHYLVVGRK